MTSSKTDKNLNPKVAFTILFSVFFVVAFSFASMSSDWFYNLMPQFYRDNSSLDEIVKNNALDGSVYQIKLYLNKNLKDPNSYQSIEWSKVDKLNDNFSVRHKYRARNSFGALHIENKIFNLNKKGEIIAFTNIE